MNIPKTNSALRDAVMRKLFGTEEDKKNPVRAANQLVLGFDSEYQGSFTQCGKTNCSASPRYFAVGFSGVPRFLCQAHTERWSKKRTSLREADMAWLYEIVINPADHTPTLRPL